MARGMDPAKVAQWTACLARFQDAGLTVVGFCEKEDVSPPSFYQWRRKLAGETKAGETVHRVGKPKQGKEPAAASRRSKSDSKNRSAFQAVEVVSANAAATIRLPDGVEIELGNDLRAFDLLVGQLLGRLLDGACQLNETAGNETASDGAVGGKEGQRC